MPADVDVGVAANLCGAERGARLPLPPTTALGCGADFGEKAAGCGLGAPPLRAAPDGRGRIEEQLQLLQPGLGLGLGLGSAAAPPARARVRVRVRVSCSSSSPGSSHERCEPLSGLPWMAAMVTPALRAGLYSTVPTLWSHRLYQLGFTPRSLPRAARALERVPVLVPAPVPAWPPTALSRPRAATMAAAAPAAPAARRGGVSP